MLDKLQENASKIITGIGVIIVVVSLLFVFISYTDYQSSVAEKQEKVTELTAKLEQTGDAEKISENDVKSQLNSVKTIGDEIARLQNRYMVLASTDYMSNADYDEESVRAEEKEIAEKIDVYFGAGTGWQRARWYAGDASKMGLTDCWTFMNSYDFSENTISVLWSCKDGRGTVVSYVTADYHADTNSFDNVQRHDTVAGMTYLNVTSDKSVAEFNQEAYVSGIQSIFESAGLSEEFQQKMEEARNREGQAEDQESNNEARGMLREQMLENGGN